MSQDLNPLNLTDHTTLTMSQRTQTDSPRLPTPSSDVIHASRTIPPTSMWYVNLTALYKEGWGMTGTLPAQKCLNFHKYGGVLNSYKWAHTQTIDTWGTREIAGILYGLVAVY